ncbi:hypothetical protein ALC62_09463 [Cyphomyrmex costatus]|uniref:Uncharacterized protein n=1 Tax=Cyphomyrmex costatus TaxID=456900 RepID=A0A195CGI8_9HYME|nr:hypothetical protein ALC62_09463 [Cyphomyrmex costatus]
MAEASRLPEVAKEMKCLPAGEAALPTPMSLLFLGNTARAVAVGGGGGRGKVRVWPLVGPGDVICRKQICFAPTRTTGVVSKAL